MKVTATWEFDVDVSDLDPNFVDISGLAVDLTRRELKDLLEKRQLTEGDFEYRVMTED